MRWIKQFFGAPPDHNDLVRPVAVRPSPVPDYTRYCFTEPAVRVAAIGDLHGRIDLLYPIGHQLDNLAQDTEKRLIEIYLGDYVDRGGNARDVVDFLVDRTRLADRDVVCLRGNHEQLLLGALDSDKNFLSWLKMGGDSTLQSYGISPRAARADIAGGRRDFRKALPFHHQKFLRSLRTSFLCGGFFFAHAGVRPGLALDKQKPKDLLWIREGFLTSRRDFGAIVVHGHTPTTKPQFCANRIGIDTGAYYSGRLTCVTITAEKVSILQPTERVGAALSLL